MIRIISYIVLSCFSIQATSQLPAQDSGIIWETTQHRWQSLLEKAKKEGKLIFVDASATWCAPCKRMDNEVFDRKDVGEFLNGNFLSVHLQIDTTQTDERTVKLRYAMTALLRKKYNVSIYPTFLFFNPQGEVIHIAKGYKDPVQFLQVAHEAMVPGKQFFTLFKALKDGRLSGKQMIKLDSVSKKLKENKTSSEIVRYFLHTYLAGRSDSQFFDREYLAYVASNAKSIRPGDKIFKRIRASQSQIDSTMGQKDYGKYIITTSVYGYELDRIRKEQLEPHWNKMKSLLVREYGEPFAAEYLPKLRIAWYKERKKWKPYITHLVRQINVSLPDSIDRQDIFGMIYYNNEAEKVFLLSSDTGELRAAARWMDIVMKTTPKHLFFFPSTQAHVLYKLGEYSEAIMAAQEAMKFAHEYRKLYPKDASNPVNEIDELIRNFTKRVAFTELPVYKKEIREFQ